MAKRLWELFYTFAKVGVMTFGGGYAMLPILQREVVENKGWATEEELADWFAIGQCTPGVIAVNTATFAGRKVLGNVGGVVATLGVVFPSLIIISLLAGVITTFAEVAWVKNAFAGIRVCVPAPEAELRLGVVGFQPFHQVGAVQVARRLAGYQVVTHIVSLILLSANRAAAVWCAPRPAPPSSGRFGRNCPRGARRALSSR